MLSSFVWVIATGRNALIVILSSVIAFYTCQGDSCLFILTGKVKSGLPQFALPKFETTIIGANGTEVHQNYKEMVKKRFHYLGIDI